MHGVKTTAPLLLALVAACALRPGVRDPLEPATSLAAAERDFAAQSVREDARTAFIAHFAPGGVFVRDGAWADAQATLAHEPAAPIVLDWHPAYVEAARSGELGLSTGPWSVRARDAAAPGAYGEFVSVWQRGDGTWRVIADIGIRHGRPEAWNAPLETRVALSAPPQHCPTLDDAESAFARAASVGGLRAALREHGAADMRLYRDGAVPVSGSAEAIAGAMDEAPVLYTVTVAQAARSGDIGYARGDYIDRGTGTRGPWLRVWRCEAGRWRVALDIVNAAR
jgi:ketosteroid isomerase-like protein